MAVRGPAPAEQRRRRNKPEPGTEWVEYVDAPYDGPVPELPETRTIVTRDGQEHVELQPLTRQWWKTISRMPHCRGWSESDWMFALATSQVADAAFCGIAAAQTELRNREKVLGATAEFRRALRIRYVPTTTEPVEDVPAAGVTKLSEYRNL